MDLPFKQVDFFLVFFVELPFNQVDFFVDLLFIPVFFCVAIYLKVYFFLVVFCCDRLFNVSSLVYSNRYNPVFRRILIYMTTLMI